jgi:hypothetical protein
MSVEVYAYEFASIVLCLDLSECVCSPSLCCVHESFDVSSFLVAVSVCVCKSDEGDAKDE